MKKLITICTSMAAVVASATAITGISANQRWPWNGLMDVDFTLSGSAASMAYRIELSATYNSGTNSVYAKSYLTEPVVEGDGAKRVTWNLGADCPELKADDFTVSVTATPLVGNDIPVYMVIDLSSGPASTKYPVRYTTTPPDLSDDTCRTTEMWFRRIKAGTFFMGKYDATTGYSTYLPKREMTLTKDFYMAIFETTQQQWAQVMGTWPSYFSNVTCRATRPVETISTKECRGTPDNGLWPQSKTVLATSFAGLMRSRAGLGGFDLPTETQWEYACRAGTTEYRYSNSPAAQLGRMMENGGRIDNGDGTYTFPAGDCDDAHGTAKVGSYEQNAWGLYDMYGNVQEVCLDRWKPTSWPEDATSVDYEGPVNTDGARVHKGISFSWAAASYMASYLRVQYTCWSAKDEGYGRGARFCVTLP